MADAVLTEGQFDLDGYLFGGEGDPLVAGPGGFDPGARGWRTQEQPSPVGDHVHFGRDLMSPGTWSWTLQVNRDTAEEALTSLEEAEIAWQGLSARSVPGAVLPLRYRLGGRTRRVYGRPRRFSHDLTPLMWQGHSTAVADFARVDTLTYDDAVRVAGLGIIRGSTTGIKSPLVGSLSTIGSGPDTITPLGDIGGTVPAPFVAVIYGPITAPYLEEDGWKIHLNTTLAYDQSVVIDTRPWAMTALRNDGASLAGYLTRDTNLQAARLAPGGTTLRFGGKDATGTAHAEIAWRPTFTSL